MAKHYPQSYLIVLAAALFCACLLGIEGWRNWVVRLEELNTMEDRGRELAKLTAQQADDVFFQAQLVLTWGADEINRHDPDSDQTLAERITEIKRRVPSIDSIAVIDVPAKHTIVDRDSTATDGAKTSWDAGPISTIDPRCANPCIQRPTLSPWTGKLIIPMSMHVSRDGVAAPVIVLATINVDVFKEYYRSLSIGPSDRIYLNSDHDFTFLARPSNNDLSGRAIVNRQLLRSYQADGPIGNVLIRSQSDGKMRLYSYRRLSAFPAFVAVGISKDDVLARWRRDVAWHLGATISFMSVVALIGLHVMRQSKLRAGAEEQTKAALQLSGQISGLSAYLESAREEERKRIAMEVHDQLGQSLTALKIEAFLLKRPDVTPDDARRTADEMIDLIDGTITTVRTVSNVLRPVALDYGIVAALQWLTTDFAKRNDILCTFHHRGPEPLLDEAHAIAIFRIAQGALTNIARHAYARSVRVYWLNDGATLNLSVVDDGCGFDVDTSLKSHSYGLLSMRQRAQICKGNLLITSMLGSGTTVSLTIPLGTI